MAIKNNIKWENLQKSMDRGKQVNKKKKDADNTNWKESGIQAKECSFEQSMFQL